MMTVVTYMTLKPGDEPGWDAAMRERLETARGVRGWLGGQLLIPLDGPNRRAIVGVWQTRADWEAWHEDPAFQATRDRLNALDAEENETVWFETLLDLRPVAEE